MSSKNFIHSPNKMKKSLHEGMKRDTCEELGINLNENQVFADHGQTESQHQNSQGSLQKQSLHGKLTPVQL